MLPLVTLKKLLQMKSKILILYAEFLGYNYAALSAFTDINDDTEIHVISWDDNKKTPYIIPPLKNSLFYPKSNFSIKSLIEFIENLHPSIILVSTRTDKDYLKVLLKFKNRIKIVGLCDAQYKKLWTQKIQILFSWYFYHRYFDYLWVAGTRQYEFAKRLGFSEDKIIMNSLVCDKMFFECHNIRSKLSYINKSIYYIGRFSDEKGVLLLVNAFIELSCFFPEWDLVLVGNGPLRNSITKHKRITIKEFMQPEELVKETILIGCFCLPSTSDAWGVALHEMAAAGVPIISSDAVGASTDFVKNGYNGYTFKNRNTTDLKSKLTLMMGKTDDQLKIYGLNSFNLGRKITPNMWAASLQYLK